MAVSRSTGKAKVSGNDKRVRFLAQQVGPFTVSFAPAYKQVTKDGKKTFQPTGELAMKVDIGDTFPLVSLGWNAEGKGALGTIEENLEAFNEAIAAAVALWQSDESFQAAMDELRAISTPVADKARSVAVNGKSGLMNRTSAVDRLQTA